jgi:hypothetical protein
MKLKVTRRRRNNEEEEMKINGISKMAWLERKRRKPAQWSISIENGGIAQNIGGGNKRQWRHENIRQK